MSKRKRPRARSSFRSFEENSQDYLTKRIGNRARPGAFAADIIIARQPLSFAGFHGQRMDVIDKIAEQAILEAQRQGHFDDLPGAGKPIVLDDDRMVPESLRMAYRVLRNAGCTPLEVATRSEISKVELELEQMLQPADRSRALRKLMLLRVAANRPDRPLWVDDGRFSPR